MKTPALCGGFCLGTLAGHAGQVSPFPTSRNRRLHQSPLRHRLPGAAAQADPRLPVRSGEPGPPPIRKMVGGPTKATGRAPIWTLSPAARTRTKRRRGDDLRSSGWGRDGAAAVEPLCRPGIGRAPKRGVPSSADGRGLYRSGSGLPSGGQRKTPPLGRSGGAFYFAVGEGAAGISAARTQLPACGRGGVHQSRRSSGRSRRRWA